MDGLNIQRDAQKERVPNQEASPQQKGMARKEKEIAALTAADLLLDGLPSKRTNLRRAIARITRRISPFGGVNIPEKRILTSMTKAWQPQRNWQQTRFSNLESLSRLLPVPASGTLPRTRNLHPICVVSRLRNGRLKMTRTH